jgi:hypothetical protein
MSTLRQLKTSFTAGEVSRRLLGRGDLTAFENGALRLENVFIHPTGGISRRPGLYYVAGARGRGRLVEFEFNTEQVYLLVFTHLHVDVLAGETTITDLAAPWTEAQLASIAWTQSADTLLVCHVDVPPRRITRQGSASWRIEPWRFDVDDAGLVHQPYFKFVDAEVTLTPSATTGTITLTASAPVFQAGHLDSVLRVGGKQARIMSVLGSTQVTALLSEDLPDTAPTLDWQEAAFSPVRGWPASVAFHQDRLVIGGSRDLPNRVWMSGTGALWNFDLGEGLDTDAVEFSILSDQVNAIRQVVSGRHLQVFTSGAEWMVTGDPLTPETVQLLRQTQVGSPIDRQVPVVSVDGATLFAGRSGRELCEFLYTDVEAAYQATDLALLAGALLSAPVDMKFDAARRIVHVVKADGTVACLTLYRTQQVVAWSRLSTDGAVLSVAVVGDAVYMLIDRAGAVGVERLDDSVGTDAALTGTHPTGSTSWSGLAHLEGRAVTLVADGAELEPHSVVGGTVLLSAPAASLQAGLPFAHIVTPLPPGLLAGTQGGQGLSYRLLDVTFRLLDTQALRVDLGEGARDIPLRRLAAGSVLDAPPQAVTADISLRALGWARDLDKPLWRIQQQSPLGFTLLSVTQTLKVTD